MFLSSFLCDKIGLTIQQMSFFMEKVLLFPSLKKTELKREIDK